MPRETYPDLRHRLTAELGENALRSYTPTTTLRHDAVFRRRHTPSVITLGQDLEVFDRLGEGGTGVVEAATETTLGRRIAVKRAHRGDDARAVERLAHEAAITARLTHPGIVPVHRLFMDDHAGPVMVMPLLDGQSWQALIGKRTADVERAVRITIEVARALEHAHARGILHLDVKPQNVLIGPSDEVHLIDWGNALDLVRDPPRTQLRGTPAFMAPEMTEPETLPLTPRTDLYLLAGSLLSAITGRPPHLRRDILGSMHAAREEVVLPEHEQLDGELRTLLARALAVDPVQRPPSVAAFRSELQRYLADARAAELVENLRRDLAACASGDLQKRAAQAERAAAIVEVWPRFAPAVELRDALGMNVLAEALEAEDLRVAHRMAELVSDHPDLEPLAMALGQLESEMERATADRRALDAQLDLETGTRERRLIFVLTAAFLGLTYLTLFLQNPTARPNPPPVLLGVVLAQAGLVGGMIAWNRRALWSTWSSRQIVIGAATAFAGPLLNRIAAVLYDVDPTEVLRNDLLLITLALLPNARLDRSFLWSGLICLLAYGVALLEPGLTRFAINFGTLVATVVLVLTWEGAPDGPEGGIKRRRRRARRP